MSIELWAAILAAAALAISLISAYFAKHSVSAAERSAIAAERAADAARDQADETRRANELVEEERRRGVRASGVSHATRSRMRNSFGTNLWPGRAPP